jgi:hypothetical protein
MRSREHEPMTTLDPHTATLLVLIMGVGYVMAYAGISKNALEWKRRRRVCPTCGRHDGGCGHTF